MMSTVYLAMTLITLSKVISQPISHEKGKMKTHDLYPDDGEWSHDTSDKWIKKTEINDDQTPRWPKGRNIKLDMTRKRDEPEKKYFNERSPAFVRYGKLHKYVRTANGSFG